jgi:DNA-binding CsgD family transcriptional regulator
MKRVFRRPGITGTSPGNLLSSRELEILKWIRDGKDAWEISVALNIAHGTVKWYIERILEKLNAADPVHAVAIARDGVLPTSSDPLLHSGASQENGPHVLLSAQLRQSLSRLRKPHKHEVFAAPRGVGLLNNQGL